MHQIQKLLEELVDRAEQLHSPLEIEATVLVRKKESGGSDFVRIHRECADKRKLTVQKSSTVAPPNWF